MNEYNGSCIICLFFSPHTTRYFTNLDQILRVNATPHTVAVQAVARVSHQNDNGERFYRLDRVRLESLGVVEEMVMECVLVEHMVVLIKDRVISKSG